MFSHYITTFLLVSAIADYLYKNDRMQGSDAMSAAIEAGVMYAPRVRQNREYWRFLTAGFVHFSLWHLLMNMYVLFQIGPSLEGGLGHGMYALLAIGSIVTGNLLQYIGDSRSTVSGGLSSALYGMMGARIVFFARAYGLQNILHSSSMIQTILLNLVMNFLPGVGWRAHIGGLSFGIILTTILVR